MNEQTVKLRREEVCEKASSTSDFPYSRLRFGSTFAS